MITPIDSRMPVAADQESWSAVQAPAATGMSSRLVPGRWVSPT